MQILLSERRICNFCKSDNSRLAQVWVCLCVQISKKYITSLCKANMSHQRRPFFQHFIYVGLFCRSFTLSICQIGLPFFRQITPSFNATSLLKSGYQRDNINLFRGKILPMQGRQWLALCRCPHLPRVRRLADQFTAPVVLCTEFCK